MIQVVDASVVVSFLVDNDHAARWCEDRLAEGDLAAPQVMPVESANILRRIESRGDRDPSAVAQALRDLLRLAVDLFPFDLLAGRAWQLRHNLTIYDGTYVAAAELIGGRLITLDRRLRATKGLRCEVLVPPDAPSEAG